MRKEEFRKLDLNNIYNYLKNEIDYGYVDNNGNKHFSSNSDDINYHLQTPSETLNRKIAICWDKTEVLRDYFESNNYEVYTYFIYLYITDDYCPSHSIIAYKKEDKYVWFEPNKSLNFEGIREYKTEEELIKDLERRFLANGFLNNFFNRNDDLDKLVCYEYLEPKIHIRGSEFYNHCRNGRKLI